MARRIVFAISDTGGGHRSAAQALVAAVEKLAGRSVECEIVDVLRLSGLPLLRSAPAIYEQLLAGWLPLYNLGFTLTNGPRRAELLLSLAARLCRERLAAELGSKRPDLVVAAHPLAALPIAMARQRAGLAFHLITVVTDLVSLHASWACRQADLCIAPTHEALDLLRRYGVPPTRLTLGAFPVHPRFSQQRLSRQAARRVLGLEEDSFTLLLTGGGLGAGRVLPLVDLLRRRFPLVQLLIVSGHNRALYQLLLAQERGSRCRVYGYVEQMDLLVAASDVVVGKAGPGTLMEALALRRPVMVTEAMGQQEWGNIDFVRRYRLGFYCPGDMQIVGALDRLRDPTAYQAICAQLGMGLADVGAARVARLLIDAASDGEQYRLHGSDDMGGLAPVA